MNEWKEYKIEEMCSKVTDGAHNSPVEVSEGYPMFSVKDMRENGFDYSDVKRISASDFEKLKRSDCKPLKYDVLIAKDGSYLKHVFVCEEDKDEIILSSIAILRPKQKITNPFFLKYILKTNSIKTMMEGFVSGSALPRIVLKDFKKMVLRLPSLSLQHRIASIPSAYDDLIENNNRRIALLKLMAEQIYKEWFVRMRFPGYENTEFEKGVPKGWEWKKVEEVFKTSSGGTPSRQKEQEYYGGEIDWIKTGELKDSFIFNSEEKITESGLNNSSAKLFAPNSLLMAMYGVNIGQLGISVKPSAANQAVCIFSPKNDEGYSLYYSFHFFKSIRSHLFNISMGAAQQNLSQDIIKRLSFLQPDKAIIDCFNQIQRPIFDLKLKLELQTQTLKQTRDLLLPRLISGKLRVKAAEMELEKM